MGYVFIIQLIIAIGVKLLMTWVLQAILLAFGVSLGYWLCFGIIFLLTVIFKSKRG